MYGWCDARGECKSGWARVGTAEYNGSWFEINHMLFADDTVM